MPASCRLFGQGAVTGYTKPTVRMAPHVEGGRTADVPWRLLLGGQGTNRDTFLGNIPLRCIFEAIRADRRDGVTVPGSVSRFIRVVIVRR